EILYERQPDLVIETGTYEGGSALYLAHQMDLIGHGKVITVDITIRDTFAEHPRIEYITGSSVDPAIVAAIRKGAEKCERVMVILDSDHSQQHVTRELGHYNTMVTPGDYL